jgi:hypothetical protein
VNWSFIRLIRLLLGVAIVIQGILTKDVIFVILGLLFGGMAVFNLGCCGFNSCSVNSKPSGEIEKLNYERPDEPDHKK